ARVLKHELDTLAGTEEVSVIIDLISSRRRIAKKFQVEAAVESLKELKERVDRPAPQDFVGHRIVMKMNQRSRGGVYEQGERISFGRPGGSPQGDWRGSRRAA